MRFPFNINAMREPLPSMISPPSAITNASISENTREAKVGLKNIAFSVFACLVFMGNIVKNYTAQCNQKMIALRCVGYSG